jgi:hypothetical protein
MTFPKIHESDGKFTEIRKRVMGPPCQLIVNTASLLLHADANFNLLFLFSAIKVSRSGIP